RNARRHARHIRSHGHHARCRSRTAARSAGQSGPLKQLEHEQRQWRRRHRGRRRRRRTLVVLFEFHTQNSEEDVYSSLQCLIKLSLSLALGLAVIGAQAQAPADQPSPSSIHGHVADPSGARIPGTLVTVTNAMGVPVKSVTADGTGDYSISGLAPGSYIVEASHTGFALYTSPTFTLEAGQNKLSDVSMSLPIAQQQVNVTSDGDYNVSTEADSNTSAIVIK